MDMRPEIAAERRKLIARRWFFRDCGVGLGGIALASLLGTRGSTPAEAGVPGAGAPAGSAPVNAPAPRQAHCAPRAKRVISLFQAGAPSHLDLFDHKPELAKRDGQLPPAGLLK